MNKILFLLCGPSGAGKSTWAQQQISETKYPVSYVSRDKIRYDLVPLGQEYFSKEDEVMARFVKEIQNSLDNGFVTYADATHLNEKSRNKLLNRLHLQDVDIYAVNFIVPLQLCIDQNELRQGTRGYVPHDALVQMYNAFKPATENERHTYTYILNVERTK